MINSQIFTRYSFMYLIPTSITVFLITKIIYKNLLIGIFNKIYLFITFQIYISRPICLIEQEYNMNSIFIQFSFMELFSGKFAVVILEAVRKIIFFSLKALFFLILVFGHSDYLCTSFSITNDCLKMIINNEIYQ